jgi:hypothetical protein
MLISNFQRETKGFPMPLSLLVPAHCCCSILLAQRLTRQQLLYCLAVSLKVQYWHLRLLLYKGYRNPTPPRTGDLRLYTWSDTALNIYTQCPSTKSCGIRRIKNIEGIVISHKNYGPSWDIINKVVTCSKVDSTSFKILPHKTGASHIKHGLPHKSVTRTTCQISRKEHT